MYTFVCTYCSVFVAAATEPCWTFVTASFYTHLCNKTRSLFVTHLASTKPPDWLTAPRCYPDSQPVIPMKNKSSFCAIARSFHSRSIPPNPSFGQRPPLCHRLACVASCKFQAGVAEAPFECSSSPCLVLRFNLCALYFVLFYSYIM